MKSVIEHIKSYVNKHLNQPITLNDIASEIGYSKKLLDCLYLSILEVNDY